MERRNTVHKYQTYFQARVVYILNTLGQQLLSIKLVEQGFLFQQVSRKFNTNEAPLL
jgi:hypothetical protein